MADAIDIAITSSVKNNEDLSNYTVVQLKKYLSNRRQNVSGRKQELVNRIKGVFKLNIPDNSSLSHIVDSDKERCELDRFTLSSGEKVSPPFALMVGWSTQYENIPDVMEKDIYNYIVLKKNAKRQLKSKIFYEDGHVSKVEVHPINDKSSHMYVRGSVMPSFPSANQKKTPDYSTVPGYCCLRLQGAFIQLIVPVQLADDVAASAYPCLLVNPSTGTYSCASPHAFFFKCWEGECCNHIGALLFGIADLVEKRRNGCLSSTSKKCIWSNHSMMSAPRKRKLSPKRSEDLDYRRNRSMHSNRKLHVEKNSDHNNSKGCTVDIDRFRKRLEEKNVNVGWLKNFPSDSSTGEPKVPKLHDIRFAFMDNVDLTSNMCKDIFDEHFRSLSLTEEDVHLTEVLTRGQDSDRWKQARKDRLTSSNFGRVCKRKDNTHPDNLLKDMIYCSDFKSTYTEYGKKHEKAARKMYVNHMKSEHKGLQVKECGLFVHQDAPFLGSSPDGLVYCSHCEDSIGVLEIKCPASMRWRMKTPEECCADKEFYCHLEDGNVKLKTGHRYYFQVQGQMGVTGKKWCDFVVWTCTGLSAERIYFDEEMWNDMYMKLEKFYINCFIPELFSRRVERGLKLL